MELIDPALPFSEFFLGKVFYFLVVIGVIVAIHEYGHYIVGRWCGIHADVFSVGYGKPLTQWTDKRGTVWQIAALPLGGYVKFKGDMNAASFDSGSGQNHDADSFPGASVWRRALTVMAGPVFNFILAGLIFTGLILYSGQETEAPSVGTMTLEMTPQHDLQLGDTILAVNGTAVTNFADITEVALAMDPPGDVQLQVERNGAEMDVTAPFLFPARVVQVAPFSAAQSAGLKIGDLITHVDGAKIEGFSDLKDIIVESRDKDLMLSVKRGGQVLDLPITPQLVEQMDADGNVTTQVLIGVVGTFGIAPGRKAVPFTQAVPAGFSQVGEVIVLTVTGLKRMIEGALSPKNLNGPLGIAMVSGQQATQGMISFISLIATISVAIGFLNLLPIPILDGGHLVFYAYEAIRGRPASAKILNMAMSIGFVLLLALMLFATYNDIQRIF